MGVGKPGINTAIHFGQPGIRGYCQLRGKDGKLYRLCPAVIACTGDRHRRRACICVVLISQGIIGVLDQGGQSVQHGRFRPLCQTRIGQAADVACGDIRTAQGFSLDRKCPPLVSNLIIVRAVAARRDGIRTHRLPGLPIYH